MRSSFAPGGRQTAYGIRNALAQRNGCLHRERFGGVALRIRAQRCGRHAEPALVVVEGARSSDLTRCVGFERNRVRDRPRSLCLNPVRAVLWLVHAFTGLELEDELASGIASGQVDLPDVDDTHPIEVLEFGLAEYGRRVEMIALGTFDLEKVRHLGIEVEGRRRGSRADEDRRGKPDDARAAEAAAV